MTVWEAEALVERAVGAAPLTVGPEVREDSKAEAVFFRPVAIGERCVAGDGYDPGVAFVQVSPAVPDRAQLGFADAVNGLGINTTSDL